MRISTRRDLEVQIRLRRTYLRAWYQAGCIVDLLVDLVAITVRNESLTTYPNTLFDFRIIMVA